MEESEVSDFQKKYRVVNIVKTEKGVVCRTLSDSPPNSESVLLTPTLEDYYLYVFNEESGT